MSVRTSRKTATFTRPFSLSGIDEGNRPALILLCSRGGGPVVGSPGGP
jgi:hypothetical protein